MNEALSCRICGNISGNRSFVGREMMFGSREEFDYFECPACGCIQITRIPDDLGKYYPAAYYSYQTPHPVKAFIKGPWMSEPFSLGTAFVRLLAFLPGARVGPEWMRRAGLKKDAAILDIGSGGGVHLTSLRQAGYKDLTGVDPFIRQDIQYRNGIRILKKEIDQLERQYDFVMMHHAYEHMPEQKKTLEAVMRVLKKDGRVLIRIPVATSYAWKHYGVNWMGLDPPRHLFIHTPKSLALVAGEAGLVIEESFSDSDPLHLVGSEQYVRGIPLRDPRSYLEKKQHSVFSRAEIRGFKKKTVQLNRENLGDSAAFYLRRKNDAR